MGKNILKLIWWYQKIRLNLSYQKTQTMEKNQIKVASTVYPDQPLAFNDWMKMVYKDVENNAKGQGMMVTSEPNDFNAWAILIHNSRN